MLKRIPPKNKGTKATPQLPLQERVRLLMERIHAGKPLWPYSDAATIKECISRGLIRKGRRYIHSRWSRNTLVPLVPAQSPEPARSPQPYAKRIADMDAAGLRRRTSPSAPRSA